MLASDDLDGRFDPESADLAKASDTCCSQLSWIDAGEPFLSASSAHFFIRASFRKYFCACVRACVAFRVPTIWAIPLTSFGPTICKASRNLVCSISVQYLDCDFFPLWSLSDLAPVLSWLSMMTLSRFTSSCESNSRFFRSSFSAFSLPTSLSSTGATGGGMAGCPAAGFMRDRGLSRKNDSRLGGSLLSPPFSLSLSLSVCLDVAATLIDAVDVFIFDCDGVIWKVHPSTINPRT
mmetsp:Transcript_11910/g.29835  ORF Transcript_11910/g.29835 Transcript_11910/m.29835 type:complete len:236 (+) Transcript_11910:657-1364(+)